MGFFLGFLKSCSIDLYLFLCQYHTVLITVALKLGSLSHPVFFFFFFLQLLLAIWGLLCFHTNFFCCCCSSSVKNAIGNFIITVLNLYISLGSIVILTILILLIL